MANELTLDQAIDVTRTGDLWLFRGRSAADQAIRTLTNSPVNHVGMAVVLEDLPPLMWHAELGQSVVDVWTGSHHRGVQLHDLRGAVTTWAMRYGQRCWLRQLEARISKDMEDRLLKEVARQDGISFPPALALAGRWLRGRLRRPAPAEATYCAEVVAGTYQAMGLLGNERPTNWYDPGRFWSGDRLELRGGAKLGGEIEVAVTADDGITDRDRPGGLAHMDSKKLARIPRELQLDDGDHALSGGIRQHRRRSPGAKHPASIHLRKLAATALGREEGHRRWWW